MEYRVADIYYGTSEIYLATTIVLLVPTRGPF